jgi:hypothetical protein
MRLQSSQEPEVELIAVARLTSEGDTWTMKAPLTQADMTRFFSDPPWRSAVRETSVIAHKGHTSL